MAIRIPVLWNSAVEALRDQPLFDVPSADQLRPENASLNENAGAGATPFASLSTATPLTHVPTAEEREVWYERDTLRVFAWRTRLMTGVAMCGLPIVWAAYAHFAPQRAAFLGGVHIGMFIACAFIYGRINRARTRREASLLTAGTYVAFSIFATLSMGAAHDPHINVLSGHAQIIISLLFMPFSLWESAACVLLIVLSYAGGLFLGATAGENTILWARVLSLSLTGAIMPIMSHLMQWARRRAFDGAFDMAVSAALGVSLSSLDPVTGGFNRRFFESTLGREIERAARQHLPLSLLMFDLDRFKPVNDTLGHAMGDEVLRVVLKAAAEASRLSDTVSRYGGDEFTIALPGTDAEQAQMFAVRLRSLVATRLRDAFGAEHLAARVTISIGLTTLAIGETTTVAELLARADHLLYEAKRGGRDRIAS